MRDSRASARPAPEICCGKQVFAVSCAVRTAGVFGRFDKKTGRLGERCRRFNKNRPGLLTKPGAAVILLNNIK